MHFAINWRRRIKMDRQLQVLVSVALLLLVPCFAVSYSRENRVDDQPLSRVALHRQLTSTSSDVSFSVSNATLGANGESYAWVTVNYTKTQGANISDWIGVFSPAKFNGSECLQDLNDTHQDDAEPYLCSAPIKFIYANQSSNYVSSGKGSFTFRIINQRYDYAFGFFSGGLNNPVLEGMSEAISFKNPNAPLWPRLALGKSWDEITVTWTSGYSISDATPVVLYKWEEDNSWTTVIAITRTYTRGDMCGPPASTIGWRDPGYMHTGFISGLFPSSSYSYKVGHKLKNGQYVWGDNNTFTSPPGPGQDSLQRVVIFGDMGKALVPGSPPAVEKIKEKMKWSGSKGCHPADRVASALHEMDGSSEYVDTQPGALNTTKAIEADLANIDLVFHNGDIVYANGYIAEWDQYVEQTSNISKAVPYMLSSGNHERDWPGSSSFYQTTDSGGECGGPTETEFYMPTKNKDKFWYEADYGMFHFCVADSEEDWRQGSEQWKWLDKCLGSVDRRSQPWLIFLAHRVLGYSSGAEYQAIGTFAEPMARESLQPLWQKHKVDIAFYGHVHNFERTCPVYESNCVPLDSAYATAYSGHYNATIHIVAGNAGRALDGFGPANTTWSIFKDSQFGYTKLTATDHNHLLFEYKRSLDNKVVDSFTITRYYSDVLGCDSSASPECPATTTADLA